MDIKTLNEIREKARLGFIKMSKNVDVSKKDNDKLKDLEDRIKKLEDKLK